MASVTVPGTKGTITPDISATFGNANNSLLAQQITDAIRQIGLGRVLATDIINPSATINPPPSNAGGTNELTISVGGDFTIPASTDPAAPDWLVVLNTLAAVTINGAANGKTTVWGGGGALTINNAVMVTVAEGADATVSSAVAGAVVAGNNSSDTLSMSGANDTVFAGTGSNKLSASGARDVLVGDTGFSTTITGGNTFVVSGVGDTIMPGAGDATVTASGSAGQIIGESGAMVVVTSGSADSVIAAAGNTTILAGDAGGSYFMGRGGVQEFANVGGSGTVFAGVGAASVFGSFGSAPGSDEVFGGSGELTLATGGSNDTIFAGSGSATIFGAFGGTIGNDVIVGGAGILEVVTGGSNDTVFGGTSAGQTVFGGFAMPAQATQCRSILNQQPHRNHQRGGCCRHCCPCQTTAYRLLEAVSGTDSVVGGSGNDTLVGGVTENSSITGAATTMTGGAGDNLFFFQNGNVNGTDVITDFAASSGNLFVMSGYDALVGGGPQSAANAALAGATSSGGNTSITLTDGTKITFDNTTATQLQGHIFSS